MGVSIFMVDSPLQYLNALEAKCHFKIEKKESVLIVFGGVSEKNFDQIKHLVSHELWEKEYYLRYNQSKFLRYLYIQALNKIGKKYGKADYMFIGEYRSDLMRHMINYSCPQKAFMLDDGNVSSITQKKIQERQNINQNTRRLRKAFNSLVGLKDSDIFDINFFTIYSENRADSSRIVVRNKYSFIKERFHTKSRSKEVFFVGNNLPELNYLEESYYLDKMKEVGLYYKKLGYEKIAYFPHRRESLEKIQKIEQLGFFTINQLSVPIEIFIVSCDSLPLEIASFYSSVLDNALLIFGNSINVTSFRIPLEEFSSTVREKTKLIYQVYDNYKKPFNIVEL